MESIVLYVSLSGAIWALGLGKAQFASTSGSHVVDVVPLHVKSKPSLPSVKPDSTFPTFNSKPLDRQIQLYLQYLAEFGSPDILIVGSSRAHQGVDPIALQRILANRGYPNIKVFNFGVNGATAQVVNLILSKLLLPEQLPRLILWADGSRAFNSGRIDLTYNKILASQGYRQLALGTRPNLPTSKLTKLGPFCVTIPTIDPTHQSANLSRAAGFYNFITLEKNVGQLCIQPSKDKNYPVSVMPANPPDAQPNNNTNLYAALGFNALGTQFKPDQYFRRYPKVSGSYDADYRNFTLQGSQAVALDNVIKLAKTYQIGFVFVNLPLTQIYLDEARTEYDQQFRAYLQQLARADKLAFYDFSQRWLYQNEYFTDPSHLNQYGAALVATQVGNSLKLPLPQAR